MLERECIADLCDEFTQFNIGSKRSGDALFDGGSKIPKVFEIVTNWKYEDLLKGAELGGKRTAVPPVFGDYSHFVTVMVPLHLDEMWMDAVQSLNEMGVRLFDKHVPFTLSHRLWSGIRLDACIGYHAIIEDSDWLSTHDLVIATQGGESAVKSLGLILEKRSLRHSDQGLLDIQLSKKYFEKNKYALLTVVFNNAFKTEMNKMHRLTSLITHIRRFKALADLRDTSLCSSILNPARYIEHFRLSTTCMSKNPPCHVNEQEYNSLQLEIMTELYFSMKLDGPSFHFLQGPPGTGKSHVIAGLVKFMFFGENYKFRKILICAPSNDACDAVTNKLLNVLPFDKVLRLRVSSKPTSDVKLKHVCMRTMVPNNRSGMNYLLQKAFVIVSTLNYTGSVIFNQCCGYFDCVIVDEAGQSIETECFIPLRLNVKKMILVGDPEQLPPTVLSMKAQRAGLGNSFMSRLSVVFAKHGIIRRLNQQYRMHPEICRFPSSLIYGSNVFTDRHLAAQRKKESQCIYDGI
ncbi:hypothetical protein ACOME3_008866 [Neoechinorhynchus agilis]